MISIHADPAALAEAAAIRLLTKLTTVQAARGEATVVLTGGTLGIATLAAVAASGKQDSVDWRRVNFWWGDERFVPKDSPDRNEQQARQALLEQLDVDPVRVHPAGAADEFADVDAAAQAYAEELRQAAQAENTPVSPYLPGQVPRFDVLLLGMGPDAHIASLFPEMAGIRETGRSVVAVRDSPKPPPERVSLTLDAINSAAEIWLVVGGNDKAGAVGLALAGASPVQVPAAGARAQRKTLWLLDEAAAAEVPGSLLDGGSNDRDEEH
ncbi:6-phosphogluconolactonase [Arthrobacter sp. I2-34]|uniref:6-phosphogluconolactonase n=1 Tax=Arthrobacter hankyongi TaxID=2904801 RepID=A0ABS9L5W3_9MICC|nr:6-phosphogluconolactonase [Arthrobacter hankyongi]MCG2622061.1 6-phosphogluconolactonase [Arthrobacter hankyongi]